MLDLAAAAEYASGLAVERDVPPFTPAPDEGGSDLSRPAASGRGQNTRRASRGDGGGADAPSPERLRQAAGSAAP